MHYLLAVPYLTSATEGLVHQVLEQIIADVDVSQIKNVIDDGCRWIVLVYTNEGEHYVYYTEHRSIGPVEGVVELQLTPNGKPSFKGARRVPGDRTTVEYVVCVDGKLYSYDPMFKRVEFFHDHRIAIYSMPQNTYGNPGRRKSMVVLPEGECGLFHRLKDPTIGPDGRLWFHAHEGGGNWVYCDCDRAYGPHRVINSFHVNKDGKAWYLIDCGNDRLHEWYMINDGVPMHGPAQQMSLTTSPGNRSYALTSRRESGMYLGLQNGHEFGPYKSVGQIAFIDEVPVALCQKENQSVLHIGRESRAFRRAFSFGVTDDNHVTLYHMKDGRLHRTLIEA